MTDFPPATPNRAQQDAATDVMHLTQPLPRTRAEPAAAPVAQPVAPAEPEQPAPPAASGSAASEPAEGSPRRIALVVLVAMVVLAVAFIVMIFVNVSSASINALAVIATPIASMVAAYYGITLSIQQVKNERAEKDKAFARADAADASSRETEVWSAQMESGLRVAMAKLNAAGVDTDEVTKAAGTPDGFF